jgi:activator of the mannose operon (transcriptional antiterminator)
MNERQKEMLKILLTGKKEIFRVEELAERLGCSEKTVRNDLDQIENFLRRTSGAKLIRKPGVGISLAIGEGEKAELFRELFSTRSLSGEERLFEIAFQLLTSRDPIPLSRFADKYFVSKNIINKDMKSLAGWLERFRLRLVSKPKLGNRVVGSELDKRMALAHLNELFPDAACHKSYVLDLFLPHEVTTVKNALDDMQRRFSVSFTDDALESLQIHALIMVKRIRQQSPVAVPEKERETAVRQREYHCSEWFCRRLANDLRLAFPEEEKIYFTWLLVGSRKKWDEGTRDKFRWDEETAGIVRRLIEKMNRLTFLPFSDDEALCHGLAVHMHAVRFRMKYGLPITNPLLENIKKMYPYMFSMVILAMEGIDEIANMPEDEAGYIVLHFQASAERLENKREKVKACIVCHMGIGMSRLLETKITRQFPDIEILGCLGKAELPDFLKDHAIDLILSTVPVEKTEIPCIVISPLFETRDGEKLKRLLAGWDKGKSFVAGKPVLANFIREDTVFFGGQKEHRYEVVEMLCMELYRKGYVEKGFIASAMQRERKSATAIGGGLAIPHGDPSMVLRSAVALAVLREPMEWGNEKVSLVFLLAIGSREKDEARGVMKEIALISETPDAVKSFMEARNYQDLLRVLKDLGEEKAFASPLGTVPQ